MGIYIPCDKPEMVCHKEFYIYYHIDDQNGVGFIK